MPRLEEGARKLTCSIFHVTVRVFILLTSDIASFKSSMLLVPPKALLLKKSTDLSDVSVLLLNVLFALSAGRFFKKLFLKNLVYVEYLH